MANLGQTFTLDMLPDAEDRTPVPAGVYSVVVDKAELKATKSGTGRYINLTLKIQGGQYNNRVVFDIINIQNPNETAQAIGLATLKKIMLAMGGQPIQDTDQLIGANLVVKVEIEKDQQYGDKNKVKDYQSVGGPAPQMNPVAAQAMGMAPQVHPTPPPAAQPQPQPMGGYTQAAQHEDLPF